MPLNYLDLEPQITQYAKIAVELSKELDEKRNLAIRLIHECGKYPTEKNLLIRQRLEFQITPPRCALPSKEPVDQSFSCALEETPAYVLLASDGSQISPSGHDPVSIALVNTSRICFLTGSGNAPEIDRESNFLFDEQGRIDLGQMSDDMVSLRRDLAELEILAKYKAESNQTILAIGDGPLELFHQPRQGENFEKYFNDYLANLKAIKLKGMLLAGYTDRPRAALVSRMLEFSTADGQKADLSRLEDRVIFSQLLKAGERSAIYELRSTSSPSYQDDLSLFFFYINVGSENKPWIARVEIPRWVTDNTKKVKLLHLAILDQCRLMGKRPYPYILHRAHEEAVVRYEEKAQLIDRLAVELTQNGLGFSRPSNKQSAKDLGPRRRIGK